MASGSFENSQFDPLLIVAQIACMQCLFYAVLCPAMLCVRAMGAGSILLESFSLDDIFLPSRVVDDNGFGAIIAHVVAAAICAVGLVLVVGKARKCWDFAATIVINHLILVLLFAHGACGYVLWWIALVAADLVCTFLGEYLCMRYELRAIPIRSNKNRAEQAV